MALTGPVQRWGPHASRAIVDAEDPRCPAYAFRDPVVGTPDRARHDAERRFGQRLPAKGAAGGARLAAAGRPRRREPGAPSVPAASDPGSGGRATGSGLEGRRQGAAAQERDAGAVVGGVPGRPPRRVRLQLVLRGLRRLQEPAAAELPAKSRRGREGLRRLRRRHDRRHGPDHRRGPGDEAVRRGDGRLELHLRPGAPERADRGLNRRPCRHAGLPRRRAEGRGSRLCGQPHNRDFVAAAVMWRASRWSQIPGRFPF